MNIIQDLTNVNFTSNGMKQIRGIVLHSMGGFYNGTISWFKNKDSQASAHYLISKTGEIRQMVRDTDVAWHSGVYDAGKPPPWALINPNWYTLGIELEDEKNYEWQYPEAQRKATKELVKFLMDKYNIPKENVLLHKNLNPSRRSDPIGMFSFDWVFGTNDPLVCDPKSVRDGFIDKASKYDDFLNNGYDSFQKVKDTIEGHQSRSTTLEKERDGVRGELAVAKEKQKQAEKALADYRVVCEVSIGQLNDRIDELSKASPDLENLRAEYEGQIGVLKDSQLKLQDKLDKANIELARIKSQFVNLTFLEKLRLL